MVEAERKTAPTLPVVEAALPPPVNVEIVPLALSAPTAQQDIQIERQRAATTVKIVWPAAAAPSARPGGRSGCGDQCAVAAVILFDVEHQGVRIR